MTSLSRYYNRYSRSNWLMLLPIIFGWMAALLPLSILTIGAFFLSIFSIIPFLKDFRSRESLAVSFILVISSMPFNISISIKVLDYFSLWGSSFTCIRLIGLFLVFEGFENVIAASLSRLIWKRQHCIAWTSKNAVQKRNCSLDIVYGDSSNDKNENKYFISLPLLETESEDNLNQSHSETKTKRKMWS